MTARVVLALALFALSPRQQVQRAASPSDATVFIRIVGAAHVEISEDGVQRAVDIENLEIGTGSGFLFSPTGYVLTNNHVVHDPEGFILVSGSSRAAVTLKVSSIEVCAPPEASAGVSLPPSCTRASVAASDANLDIAALFIGGSNHPYVALGDSDAVHPGLPVDALGFPFGRDVEVGKVATAPDLVPEVSLTPGAISALRTDDAGEPRYLQVTNTLNPGNSGGPLVTREGFAVGVICMRLTGGTGIGFAIPVRRVVDFLEGAGLDQFLPASRLRLGPLQDFAPKGVAIRLPEGMTDTSRFRSQVEAAAPVAGVALRIDRVVTPWSAKRLEDTLLGAQLFEPAAMVRRDTRAPARPVSRRLLIGGALGALVDGNEDARMDYAVLDLGAEKLVARYIGSAQGMAINESVMRESLLSLSGRLLIGGGPPAEVEGLAWTGGPTDAGQDFVPLPAGWVVEPGRPSLCQGLPQPDRTLTASPVQDFTRVVRAALWSDDRIQPVAATGACSPRRGSFGEASYTRRDTWLGVAYTVEGVFVRTGQNRILQLEVVSTDTSAAYARDLLAAWVTKAAR